MALRFTQTSIWKDERWFKNLTSDYKLVWFFLKDVCDHSGVWKIDCLDLMEYTSLKDFNISNFLSEVNVDYDVITGKKIVKERILLIQKKYLWITHFVHFQYRKKDFTVNPLIPTSYSAIELLDNYGILNEGLIKGYLTLSQPYFKGMLRAKDKDKVKEYNGDIKGKFLSAKSSLTVDQPLTSLDNLKKSLTQK